MIASSPFGSDQLAAWRRLLVDEARRLGADLDALDTETDGENAPSIDNHPADGATDQQDQTIVGAEAMEVGATLRLVQRAIDKIDTARPVPFGICELSGQPIEHERLQLMPWTPFSSAASEQLERGGLTVEAALLPV
jgi:RNA polymerase-binding transcription factor DksA